MDEYLYHGTTDIDLKGIKRVGLCTGQTVEVCRYAEGFEGECSDPSVIYVTGDERDAIENWAFGASERSGGEPVVIRMRQKDVEKICNIKDDPNKFKSGLKDMLWFILRGCDCIPPHLLDYALPKERKRPLRRPDGLVDYFEEPRWMRME